MEPRQTLSYLRNLFAERGIRPKNKLGQNFLIDLNLLDLLLRAADLTREDLVLEVGSGTGSLTVRLAEHDLVRRLPPAVFWPRPQVDSAIVRIRPVAAKRAHVGDVLRFRNFLR